MRSILILIGALALLIANLGCAGVLCKPTPAPSCDCGPVCKTDHKVILDQVIRVRVESYQTAQQQ